jgi:hypothetical protein
MDSVSNGTKVMRPQYRELLEAEKGAIDNIKRLAGELYDVYEAAMAELAQEQPPAMAREIAVAKTKLEESVMWGVKGITK